MQQQQGARVSSCHALAVRPHVQPGVARNNRLRHAQPLHDFQQAQLLPFLRRSCPAVGGRPGGATAAAASGVSSSPLPAASGPTRLSNSLAFANILAVCETAEGLPEGRCVRAASAGPLARGK